MAINWQEVSDQIVSTVDRFKLYFDGYEYTSDNNFLYGITPRLNTTFKPKVANILILGTNYGWNPGSPSPTFDWSAIEAAIDADKQLINEKYEDFVVYKVFVFVDLMSARQYDSEHPGARYENSLQTSAAQIQAFCEEMTDKGFEYKGEASPDPSFYQDLIQTWYDEITET